MEGVTLYIDHGTATTVAVLARPPHAIEAVAIEPPTGPNPTAPDAGSGTDMTSQDVTVDGTDVLRRVYQAATAQAHGHIDRVVMVVAAHRGPRWRADLKRRAHHAGFVVDDIIDGPAAIVGHLTSTQPTSAAALIVVCDLGASGMEASLFTVNGHGYDMQSVVDNPTGGDAIDAAIAAIYPGTVTTQDARQAKHTLAHSFRTRITNAGSGQTVEIDHTDLEKITAPIWRQYADTIREAITSADETLTTAAGIYLIGGGANLPSAAQALREHLDLPVIVCPTPEHAAVHAAASTHTPLPLSTSAPVGAPVRIPFRAIAMAGVPVFTAAALYYQYLSVSVTYSDAADPGLYGGDVLAPWGNLGLAALLTILAAIAAATAIAAAQPSATQTVKARAPVMTAAIIAGMIISVVFGLVAQEHLLVHGPYLRTVLLSTLPVAITVVILAHLPHLTARPVRPEAPAISWQRLISITLVGIGVVAAQAGQWWTAPYSLAYYLGVNVNILDTLWEHTGAALFGVGVAVLLSRRTTPLLYTAPALALIATSIVGYRTTDAMILFYVAALSLSTIIHAINDAQPLQRE